MPQTNPTFRLISLDVIALVPSASVDEALMFLKHLVSCFIRKEQRNEYVNLTKQYAMVHA